MKEQKKASAPQSRKANDDPKKTHSTNVSDSEDGKPKDAQQKEELKRKAAVQSAYQKPEKEELSQ